MGGYEFYISHWTCDISYQFVPTGEYVSVKKVQVGNDQKKAQSERDFHCKNRGGEKPN